ncbi:signal peptidase I, partial [bacterium]|nr:signal peptidase I [bacterium]
MKIPKLLVLSIIVTLLSVATISRPTMAQQFTQCGGDSPASALTPIQQGTFDIYVKLGTKEVSEQAVLSTQSLDAIGQSESCIQLASAKVNGTTFTKVASNVPFAGGTYQLYLGSASSTGMQSASSPQVILTDPNTDLCQLAADCKTQFQGKPMVLSPKKISQKSDALRVGYLVAPDQTKVQKVIYSVDGKPVYEKKTLQDFDTRYVSGGDHTLTRRVVFTNGSSLSDTAPIERGTIADIPYTVQAIFLTQSNTIRFIVYAILALIVWSFCLAVLKAVHRKRIWKQTHIATASVTSVDSSKAGAQATFYDESIPMTLFRYRVLLLGLLLLASGALVVTTFIVGVFTVDGVSMYPTLQDTSVHPLVKAQKTLSQVNRNEYMPPRGAIVVVQKEENNLFDPTAVPVKEYVVKRVVGLPGERVTVKDGIITVYNDQYKQGFVPDDTFKWVADTTGSEYFSIDITLKDSELFVVGDNRDESIDSRFYGPVDASQVVGRVI